MKINSLECLAIAPLQALETSVEIQNGFAISSRKNDLIKSTVVFKRTGDTRFEEGDVVFLNPESSLHAWAKKVFTLEGKPFILAPVEFVYLTGNDRVFTE